MQRGVQGGQWEAQEGASQQRMRAGQKSREEERGASCASPPTRRQPWPWPAGVQHVGRGRARDKKGAAAPWELLQGGMRQQARPGTCQHSPPGAWQAAGAHAHMARPHARWLHKRFRAQQHRKNTKNRQGHGARCYNSEGHRNLGPGLRPAERAGSFKARRVSACSVQGGVRRTVRYRGQYSCTASGGAPAGARRRYVYATGAGREGVGGSRVEGTGSTTCTWSWKEADSRCKGVTAGGPHRSVPPADPAGSPPLTLTAQWPPPRCPAAAGAAGSARPARRAGRAARRGASRAAVSAQS